jgi:tetratricopeptide (TPR) repeat protein
MARLTPRLGFTNGRRKKYPTHQPTFRLGEAYARAARIDPAIGAFRSALELDPDNGDALEGLGSALVRKNALADAIVILEKAAARGDTAGIWNRLVLASGIEGLISAHAVRGFPA